MAKRSFVLQRVFRNEKQEVVVEPLEGESKFSLEGAWKRKEKKYPGQADVLVVLPSSKG